MQLVWWWKLRLRVHMQLGYHENDKLAVYARIQGKDDMNGMEVLCTDIDFISGSLCFVHIQWDFGCFSIFPCHEEIFIDKNTVVLHCNAEHGIRYIEKSQTTGGMDL